MQLLSWLFLRGNDLTTQFLLDALFFRDSILAGKFPFWNPWIFAGMPYLLDPQNFLWYPPNYVLLLFPLELGFLMLLFGHLVFAGYFLKKILNKYPHWIQFFGIFLYLMSPKLISHLEEGNWTLVIAATWLPALYWSLVNKRFWWMAVSLSALIINNLNVGYYSILFVLLWFLVQFFHKSIGDRAPFYVKVVRTNRVLASKGQTFQGLTFFSVRTACFLFLAVAVFTLPRWLPLVLWGNQTVRAGLHEAPLPFWSWTKIAKSLFDPLATGHPQLQNEEILYVGIIPILLLVWKGLALRTQGQALLSSKGRSLQGPSFSVRVWTAWLAFVFLVALNVKTPLFSFIQLLPGFSLLRITTRPWIFVTLFVALAVPFVILRLSRRSTVVVGMIVLGILGEYGVFGYQIYKRREIPQDPLPLRFYERMVQDGTPVRAYCTIGCLDRLTAQRMEIALLHGNNPIQLNEFVSYLQEAGGYRESSYHPILPPYTVFNQEPQPDALLLGKTATRFVISPYELTDLQFELIDQEKEYRLYQNEAPVEDFKDHYFGLER